MTDLAAFTAQILEAYRAGTRFIPDSPVPRTAAQAFEVQAALAREFGPVGGFKVGGDLDTAPIMAPILASRIVASGAAIPVVDQMGVEMEVGFEVLAPIRADMTPEALAAALRPVPVIEIVDARVDGPLASDPMVKLADMQINQGLVVGPPLEGWTGADFGTVSAQMRCGSETLLDGSATVPGGSALKAVRTLAGMVGSHCGGLVPGQIVITGSLCGLPYYPAGTEVRGRIEGLGEVAVSLI